MTSATGGTAHGVSIGLSLYTGQADGGGPRFVDLPLLAAAAEGAGFDAFWVSEHHGFDDGYLPSPLVALAAAAQATSTITLATGVVLATLQHPVRLAEDAAVVDHLSGGRLLLGLGSGYLPAEFTRQGTPMAGRGRRLAEALEVLRLAWTGERFTYHGRLWSLEGVRVTPAPLRPIPVWLGGYADAAIDRAATTAGHLVGRASPELVDRADRRLRASVRAGDPTFTFGVMLTLAGDGPRAAGASARAAFARQQLGYERAQTEGDAYAGRLPRPAGDRLLLGGIDAYIQLRGDAATLVEGIVTTAASLRHWPSLHLSLRALYPGEETGLQVERVAWLGDEVLPEVRRRLGALQDVAP
ncbi:LLM class flavin-dependent oxidoreductase [Acidimicrobiaceae bacterium USS-CC1]|uniref:LLM class flavin-dependent oxidoreductase n=1 Tax=Acidiferrimicrobium australe TaxID=2664430 RepID=A0ABW9QXK9_9ACTN|nr:LLM class flavin-dependent oxidoreductase [Acidiferrimicrobium australe]